MKLRNQEIRKIMKLYKITLALCLGIGSLTSCSDKLELTNPNQQTTGTFGNNIGDLEEAVIAAYNHIRIPLILPSGHGVSGITPSMSATSSPHV